MSNIISKIHYAVEIQTDYDGTVPSIGMSDAGVIRYVTDGYDVAGATYEDSTPVTGSWNSSLLARNGIKSPTQSIDIITGGDYSFLGSLNIDIVNASSIHETILETDGLYIVGATVRMYIVLDDVFYSRGVFSVSEYSFSDTKFSYICRDQHNSSNSTIKNVVYGYNDTKLTPVIEDENAFIDKQFIKRIEPSDSKTIQNFNSTSNVIPSDDYFLQYYNGMSPTAFPHLSNDVYDYNIYLNGSIPDITMGMFVSFNSDSDHLYYISSVEIGSWDTDEQAGVTRYTKLTISGIPEDITDITNCYGIQPSGATIETIYATNVADENIISVSVYKRGLTFSPVSGSDYVMEQGKFVGSDADGNKILIDGVINDDGSLTLTTNEYTRVITPIQIQYFGDTNEGEITSLIDNGRMTNLQDLGTTVSSMPNDFRPNGNLFTTDATKHHYFVVEFGEDVDGYTPVVMLNAGTDSTENWTFFDAGGGNFYPVIISKYDTTLADPTVYYSYVYNNDLGCAASQFGYYDIDVYKVISDKERGEVPFVSTGFTLPNLRQTDAIYKYTSPTPAGDYPWNIRVKSVASTNAPESIINQGAGADPVDYITGINGVIDWGIEYYNGDPSQPLPLPKSKLDLGSNPTSVESSKKLMFRISARKDSASLYYIKAGNAIQSRLEDYNSTAIGVNTLAVYKTETIGLGDEITLKTISTDDETNTYSEVIRELSGSSSALVNRDSWFVGNQITDEINTFDVVTNLCKQGFVTGHTDRSGNVVLKEFLNDTDIVAIHDNNVVIRNSIKGFQLSPLSKCYNEFTVKYHSVNGEFKKELGVYNVDADTFPDFENYEAHEENIGVVQSRVYYDFGLETDVAELTFGDYGTDGYPNPPIVGKRVKFTTTTLETCEGTCIGTFGGGYKFSDITTTITPNPAIFYDVNHTDIMYQETEPLWKTFVAGIDSYPDAKEIWEVAHNSYLINKRIRVAPASISELNWAVDLNTFYGSDNYEPGYGLDYFRDLVSWTTRQKLTVKYDLPISDGVELNIMDKISFADPLILPENGAVGNGWITSIGLDTVKNIFHVGITFEKEFMSPPIPVACPNIIETGSADIDIIETGSNIDDIIDGCGGE